MLRRRRVAVSRSAAPRCHRSCWNRNEGQLHLDLAHQECQMRVKDSRVNSPMIPPGRLQVHTILPRERGLDCPVQAPAVRTERIRSGTSSSTSSIECNIFHATGVAHRLGQWPGLITLRCGPTSVTCDNGRAGWPPPMSTETRTRGPRSPRSWRVPDRPLGALARREPSRVLQRRL